MTRLLSPADLAARLPKVSEQRLAFWRHRDRGPRWHRIGNTIWYSEDDVEAWLRTLRVDVGGVDTPTGGDGDGDDAV